MTSNNVYAGSGYGYDQNPPAYPGDQKVMSPPPAAQMPVSNPMMNVQNTTVLQQPMAGSSTLIIQSPPPRPPSYLILSVLVTIFCNFPCGLIAIIFSVMSSSEADGGNMETARSHGRIALWLNIIGIILTVGAIVFVIIYFFAIVDDVVKGGSSVIKSIDWGYSTTTSSWFWDGK